MRARTQTHETVRQGGGFLGGTHDREAGDVVAARPGLGRATDERLISTSQNPWDSSLGRFRRQVLWWVRVSWSDSRISLRSPRAMPCSSPSAPQLTSIWHELRRLERVWARDRRNRKNWNRSRRHQRLAEKGREHNRATRLGQF